MRASLLVLAACGSTGTTTSVPAPKACAPVEYSKHAVANRLLVLGDRLIAAQDKSIASYPLGGGAPTTIVDGEEGAIEDVIAVGDQLVYAVHGPPSLRRVPLAGGKPVTISGDLDGPEAVVAIDGGYVVGGLTAVYRVATDGATQKLADGNVVSSLASRRGRGYVVLQGQLLEITRSGDPNVLVELKSESALGWVAATDNAIVFGGSAGLSRYDFATHKTSELAGGDLDVRGLAAAGDDVLANVGHGVSRVRAGKLEKLVETPEDVVAVTAAGDAVYYAVADGKIARSCLR
jgi:hypothetical protein